MSAFDPPAPPETAKPSRWRHPVVLAAGGIAALVALLAGIGAIRHKPPAPAAADLLTATTASTVTVGDSPAAAPGATPAPPPRIGMRPAFGEDSPMRPGARLAWASPKPGNFRRPPATDETAWVPRSARAVGAGGEISFGDSPRSGALREFARGTLTGFVRIDADGKYTLRADAENASSFDCSASLGGVKFASLDWQSLGDGQFLPLQSGFHAVTLLCAFSVGETGTVRLSILPEGGGTPTPMQLFLPASPTPTPTKADVLAGDGETASADADANAEANP